MKITNIFVIICFLLLSCNINNKSKEDSLIEESKVELKSDTLTLKFPKPIGYVSDFENLFTVHQINELEKRLSEYEINTKRKIAIVTVGSIEPYQNILDFTFDLANEWGVLGGDPNNSVIILLSKSIREISIVTSLETRKRLTDEICEKLINKTIIPEFKKDDYYIGIEKSVTYLINYW
jgi:uncharacterized protein